MITIIIPAFNERSVITRTLKSITDNAAPGELDVIVVCNGCKDDTATVARGFGQSVRVIETEVGSKPNALNLGDQAARTFPRVYIDADVLISIDTIRTLVKRLEQDDVFAVAPTPNIDVAGCSWLVRALLRHQVSSAFCTRRNWGLRGIRSVRGRTPEDFRIPNYHCR